MVPHWFEAKERGCRAAYIQSRLVGVMRDLCSVRTSKPDGCVPCRDTKAEALKAQLSIQQVEHVCSHY